MTKVAEGVRDSKEQQRPTMAAVPDVIVGSHFFSQRYLFAFATQGELLHHLRMQTLTEEYARHAEILAQWQAQQPQVQLLQQSEAGLADQAVLQEIPAEFRARLQEIESDPLLRKTFSTLPFSFGMVEIDKLVAPQRNVNLDYVKRLHKLYSGSLGVKELVEICVSHTREMPPIQHLEVGNSTHVFSSPNLDMRFLGAYLKELVPADLQFAEMGGIPAAAIIAFVGYGGAPINVLRHQNRLILNNGFHRVFALRALGITEIPVVIQYVNNWQLEFPATVGGLPREYLLGATRPVLMKDFFEEGFCITLRAKEKVRTVMFQAAVNQCDVPS